jgi:CDP-glucose 4,6-dehydratase
LEDLVKSFWRGKKVFLTGHAGFKGSWMSLWLQMLEAKALGYSRSSPSSPSLFDSARVASGMQSIKGDICDVDSLRSAMHSFAPEVVLHFAAQPIVRESYKNPVETYKTNVMGTVNILECVRSCPSVRAVVVVTSDKCYENQEWPWLYRETDRLGGHDPYSNSKACAELVVSCYSNSFFNPQKYGEHGVVVASARAGNVIGGGDWAKDRLIPDIIRAFAAKETVRIRSPHAIRPWQHVLEALKGYLMLAQRMVHEGSSFSGPWNFGPNTADLKTVEWIVQKLASQWGDGARWECDSNPQLHEAAVLKIDWSKAAAGLGWRPAFDLAQCLQVTTDWYKGFHGGRDARALCLEQIGAFHEMWNREMDRP